MLGNPFPLILGLFYAFITFGQVEPLKRPRKYTQAYANFKAEEVNG